MTKKEIVRLLPRLPSVPCSFTLFDSTIHQSLPIDFAAVVLSDCRAQVDDLAVRNVSAAYRSSAP